MTSSRLRHNNNKSRSALLAALCILATFLSNSSFVLATPSYVYWQGGALSSPTDFFTADNWNTQRTGLGSRGLPTKEYMLVSQSRYSPLVIRSANYSEQQLAELVIQNNGYASLENVNFNLSGRCAVGRADDGGAPTGSLKLINSNLTTHNLQVGNDLGAQGNVMVSGGSLTAGVIDLGINNGHGVLTIDNSRIKTNTFILGYSDNVTKQASSGICTIKNGIAFTVDESFIIGKNQNTIGVLNIGGSVDLNGNVLPPEAPGQILMGKLPDKDGVSSSLPCAIMMNVSGKSTINFNHTSDNYLFDTPIVEALDYKKSVDLINSDKWSHWNLPIVVDDSVATVNAYNGTTILTAHNTFKGATNVYGGELRVNGALSQSDVTVLQKGKLRGVGTVQSLTSSAVTAPGDPQNIGTLRVANALILEAPHTYECRATKTAADKIEVGGKATVNGKVSVQIQNLDFKVGKKYTHSIVSSSNLGGAFTTVEAVFNPAAVPQKAQKLFHVALESKANQVLLNVTFFGLQADKSLTKDEKSIATSMDESSKSGKLKKAYSHLLSVSGRKLKTDLASLRADDVSVVMVNQAFGKKSILSRLGDAIDPDTYSTASPWFAQQLAQLESPVSKMIDNLGNTESMPDNGQTNSFIHPKYKRGASKAPLPALPKSWQAKLGKFNVWIESSMHQYNSKPHEEKGEPVAPLRYLGTGSMIGADYKVSQNTRIGLTGGYDYSQYSNSNTQNKGHIHSYDVGTYAVLNVAQILELKGLAGYSQSYVTGKRHINMANLDLIANRKNKAQSYYGILDLALALDCGDNVKFKPFVGASFNHVHENAYQENGASNLSLAVPKKDRNYVQGHIGGKFSKALFSQEAQLYCFVKAEYLYRTIMGEGSKSSASFIDQSNAFLTTNGRKNSHLFSPGAGITGLFYGQYSVTLAYDATIGQYQNDHTGMLKIAQKL